MTDKSTDKVAKTDGIEDLVKTLTEFFEEHEGNEEWTKLPTKVSGIQFAVSGANEKKGSSLLLQLQPEGMKPFTIPNTASFEKLLGFFTSNADKIRKCLKAVEKVMGIKPIATKGVDI